MQDWRDIERARGKLLYEAPIVLREESTGAASKGIGGGPPDRHEKTTTSPAERSRASIALISSIAKLLIKLSCIVILLELVLMLFIKDFLFLFLLVLGMSILMLILGIIVLYRTRTVKEPEKVYTNGFTVPNGLRGYVFIPWSRVLTYSEFDLEKGPFPEWMMWDTGTLMEISDKGVALHGRGYSKHVLSADIDDYERILEIVKDKAGKAEYDSQEFHRTMLPTIGINILACLAISLFAGVLFSFMFIMFFPTVLGVGWGSVLIYGPLLALLTFPIFLLFLTTTFWGMPKGVVPHAYLSVGFVALLILFIGSVSNVEWTNLAPAVEVGDHNYDISSALPPGEYVGIVRNIDGPVIIGYGEELTIRDSVITFEERFYNFVLIVKEGGRLNLENTTLSPKNPNGLLSIEVRGTLVMDGCFVDRLDYYIFYLNGLDLSGGLQLKTDDAVVSNTTFMRSRGWSIMVDRCSPTIHNCTFLDGILPAIWVVRGAPTIADCTFDDDDEGVYMDDSTPIITNCTFKGSGRGVVGLRSEPTVVFCTFDENVGRPIVLDLYSSAVVEGNTLAKGQPLVTTQRDWPNEQQPWTMQRRDAWPFVGISIMLLGAVPLHTRFLHMQATRGRPAKKRAKIIPREEEEQEDADETVPRAGPDA